MLSKERKRVCLKKSILRHTCLVSSFPTLILSQCYTHSPSEMCKIKQGLINVSSLSENSHPSPSVSSFITFFHIRNAISEQSILERNKVLWVADLRLGLRFIFISTLICVVFHSWRFPSLQWKAFPQQTEDPSFSCPRRFFLNMNVSMNTLYPVDCNPITSIGNRCCMLWKTNIHLKNFI